MYCNHCGTQLPEGAKFCQNCGKQIGTAPNQKNLLTVLAVAAAVILAVVLLIVVLKKDKPAEPEPEAPEQMQQETSVSEPEPEPIPDPEPAPEPEPEVSTEESVPEPARAPDPDTYFGTEIGLDENRKYNITFLENPAQAINDYLHLLEDNYGMMRIYSNNSDNVQQRSMQKGEDEYAFVSLELTACDDGSYALWIMYGTPVELVQAEVAETPPAIKPAPIHVPDPNTFFGTEEGWWTDRLYYGHFSDDPTDAINHYLNLLKDSCGMELVYSYTEERYEDRTMQKGEDENASVFLQINYGDDGTYTLWIQYGDAVEPVHAETWGTPLKEVIVVSGPQLQDPGLFFGGIESQDTDYSAEGNLVYYRLPFGDKSVEAALEYADLITGASYPFRLESHLNETILYLKNQKFYYSYTGSEDLSLVSKYECEDGGRTYHPHVYLSIQKNGMGGYVGVTLVFSPDIELTDAGFRCSIELEGTVGSSSGSSSSSVGSSNARTPCGVCDRSGNCQTCDGDGYLMSAASGKEDRNCYACRNHNGKCTSCNGTGWLN